MSDEELALAIREMAHAFLLNEGEIDEDDKVSNDDALKLLRELLD